jgi:hypothetical protein
MSALVSALQLLNYIGHLWYIGRHKRAKQLVCDFGQQIGPDVY